MIKAPWTDEQVAQLNAFQANPRLHGYTCDQGHLLVATNDGWVCPKCNYTQDWAHSLAFLGALPEFALKP